MEQHLITGIYLCLEQTNVKQQKTMKSELESEKHGKVFKKRSISSQQFDFDLIYHGPRQYYYTSDAWFIVASISTATAKKKKLAVVYNWSLSRIDFKQKLFWQLSETD